MMITKASYMKNGNAPGPVPHTHLAVDSSLRLSALLEQVEGVAHGVPLQREQVLELLLGEVHLAPVVVILQKKERPCHRRHSCAQEGYVSERLRPLPNCVVDPTPGDQVKTRNSCAH